MSRWTVDRTDPEQPALGFADRPIVLDADVLWDVLPGLGLGEVEQAITALAALVPPTAGEIVAHIEAGGKVEVWNVDTGSWAIWLRDIYSQAMVTLRLSDPSTPQPGFRLVPLDGAE